MEIQVRISIQPASIVSLNGVLWGKKRKCFIQVEEFAFLNGGLLETRAKIAKIYIFLWQIKEEGKTLLIIIISPGYSPHRKRKDQTQIEAISENTLRIIKCLGKDATFIKEKCEGV